MATGFPYLYGNLDSSNLFALSQHLCLPEETMFLQVYIFIEFIFLVWLSHPRATPC